MPKKHCITCIQTVLIRQNTEIDKRVKKNTPNPTCSWDSDRGILHWTLIKKVDRAVTKDQKGWANSPSHQDHDPWLFSIPFRTTHCMYLRQVKILTTALLLVSSKSELVINHGFVICFGRYCIIKTALYQKQLHRRKVHGLPEHKEWEEKVLENHFATERWSVCQKQKKSYLKC